MPVYRAKYSYAIVFLNRRTDGTPSEVSVTLKELGLDNPTGYHIEDLYDEHVYGVVTPDRRFKVDVNPSGSVVMIRCDIKKGKQPLQQSLNKPPWEAAPSTRRSGATTMSRQTRSLFSPRAPRRPGSSETASKLLNKPTSLSNRPPIQQPMTIGTSLATASRTSTDSTSTLGRSRKGQRPRMGGIVHCGAFLAPL